ncbi:MAG: hypothetical protein AABY08_04795, partial [Candidatus Thermoplasmatota archaeon]
MGDDVEGVERGARSDEAGERVRDLREAVSFRREDEDVERHARGRRGGQAFGEGGRVRERSVDEQDLVPEPGRSVHPGPVGGDDVFGPGVDRG